MSKQNRTETVKGIKLELTDLSHGWFIVRLNGNDVQEHKEYTTALQQYDCILSGLKK